MKTKQIREFLRIKQIVKHYLATTAMIKLSISFVLGTGVGALLWYLSGRFDFEITYFLTTYVSPFGAVLIKMLKMIILPIIFFTLIVGAASLPIRRLGKIGIKLIFFYLLTSIISTTVGFVVGVIVGPGKTHLIDWMKVTPAADSFLIKTLNNSNKITSVTGFFLDIFDNPISSLSKGNYIPIIILALLFGFAINVLIESNENPEQVYFLQKIVKVFGVINTVTYKIVNWIMKYAPIGVFALSTVNTGIYGPRILGPYFHIVIGVVLGVFFMILIVYPILFKLLLKKNYFSFLKKIEAVMVTAFVTRSSAATLPFALKASDKKLKMKKEFYSFALPLGSTLNMDGICVHLPIYVVFAANIFGYNLGLGNTISLIFTTFLITIGVGGIPGGSMMLLIFILNSMGVNSMGEAIVMSVALGLNPLLDMFETMNNVTGDLVCSYIIADREGLVDE